MRNLRSLLTYRGFMIYWFGQSLSQMGNAKQWLAFPLWVHSMTGSLLATSVAFSLQSLTNMLLSPIAGALADRWNPKAIVLAADLARGALLCGLFLVHRPEQLWLAYSISLGLSLLGACFQPGQAVMVRRMLPKEQVPAANSLLSLSYSAAYFLGPVLGGVASSVLAYHAVFALNATTFFISALVTLCVRLPASDDVRPARRRPFLGDILAGLVTAIRMKEPRLVLTWILVTNLMVGANSILFLTYFREIGLSSTAIGGFVSAEAVGMILASLAIGLLGRTAPSLWSVCSLSVLALGMGMLGLLLTMPDRMVLAFIALVLTGGSVMAFGTATRTLLQIIMPVDLVGRLAGVSAFVTTGATLAATLMAGFLGQWLSSRALLLGAAGCLLMLSCLGLALRGVRNLFDEAGARESATDSPNHQ